MKGRLSKETLLTLRANNPEAFAKIIADYNSPDSDTKTLEDGTIVSRPKNSPSDTPYKPVATDQAKAAKAAADLANQQQQTATSKSTEEKNKVDTLKASQSIADPEKANSPEVIQSIADTLKEKYSTIEAMSITERFDALSKYRVSAAQGATAETIKSAGGRRDAAHTAVQKTSRDIASREMRRAILESGRLNTGWTGSKTIGEIAVTLFPGSDKAEAERLTRQFLAESSDEVISAGADMKGAFSDPDRQMLQEAVGGSRTLSQNDMLTILAMRDFADRRKLEQQLTERSRARKILGEADDDIEDYKPAPLSKNNYRTIDADLVAEAVRSKEGANYLKKLVGPGSSEELIRNAGQVVDAKLPPDLARTYRSAKLPDLIRDRDLLAKATAARVGPDGLPLGHRVKGVIDLIIAQRQAAGEK